MPLYPQLVEHFDLTSRRAPGCRRSTPGGPAADGRPARRQRRSEIFQGAPFARGGDVITKVGGKPIANADDLSSAIARFKPGETVDVESTAAARRRTSKVKLGERPLGDPAG